MSDTVNQASVYKQIRVRSEERRLGKEGKSR